MKSLGIMLAIFAKNEKKNHKHKSGSVYYGPVHMYRFTHMDKETNRLTNSHLQYHTHKHTPHPFTYTHNCFALVIIKSCFLTTSCIITFIVSIENITSASYIAVRTLVLLISHAHVARFEITRLSGVCII